VSIVLAGRGPGVRGYDVSARAGTDHLPLSLAAGVSVFTLETHTDLLLGDALFHPPRA
jgi:hypothetical protein